MQKARRRGRRRKGKERCCELSSPRRPSSSLHGTFMKIILWRKKNIKRKLEEVETSPAQENPVYEIDPACLSHPVLWQQTPVYNFRSPPRRTDPREDEQRRKKELSRPPLLILPSPPSPLRTLHYFAPASASQPHPMQAPAAAAAAADPPSPPPSPTQIYELGPIFSLPPPRSYFYYYGRGRRGKRGIAESWREDRSRRFFGLYEL